MSGITIMQMDAGLDTGAMLLRGELPIGPRGTAAALHDALAALGGGACLARPAGGAARGSRNQRRAQPTRRS